MDKKQAVEYLESFDSFKKEFTLDNIKKLLAEFDNPQNSFKSIKIAGTNGKGSTSSFLSSILKSAGFKTGLVLSPHVLDYNERIQVNGKPISDENFAKFIEIVKNKVEEKKIESSLFEILTTAQFLYFKEQKIDFAVLEIGLGGRLDAINTAQSIITIITNVEIEHANVLGSTFEQIALEKSEALNENSVLITSEGKPNVLEVFEQKVLEKNSEFFALKVDFDYKTINESIEEQEFDFNFNDKILKSLRTKIIGPHQFKNASLAVAAAIVLNNKGFEVDDESIRLGLMDAHIPARFQKVFDNPLIFLDSAHNPSGCMALSRTIKRILKDKTITLVFGCSEDKNYKEMLSILLPLAKRVYFTQAKYRGRDAQDLSDSTLAIKPGIESYVIPDVQKAVLKAKSDVPSSNALIVCGSIFLVSEALKVLEQK